MLTRNMITQMMALDQEQEMVAQFMSTQPHSGGIHMQNYRKAAGETNAKKHTELQTVLLQNSTSVKAEIQAIINQQVATLKSEMTTNKLASDGKLKLLTDSQEDMKNDVAFVRHQLSTVGEQITLLDRFVSVKNKHLLDRIEKLEKDVLVLKTPPPKSEFQWFEFILCLFLIVVPLIGFFLKKSESGMLTIGY